MRTPAPDAFTPGAIVAGRYRLVALLGRGGMGEVYRAHDLTLDQPVALKFLSGGAAADDSRLAQFHNELRTARQVSHKNVVRLYDLGDADGRRFLTMEYVDGEDLASLLRRIGRIPQDKAVDLARQLCAGVAAAHARGVLHRDLKPANVMIDGAGDVRITDFGIAGSDPKSGSDPGISALTFAGTPQYMAPEQLSGKPASVRTDIYALGLILFEIFTGRRAYDAKSLGDLKQLHDTGTVTTPSSIVRDLDPAIERVILRCLEKDPERRPGSALAVAAALPGGDPLAAALAAGETPSPDLLAAAGETGALPVARGLGAVAFIFAGLVALAVLSGRGSIAGLSPLDKAPAVLADRAQQLLTGLGYSGPVADSAHSFSIPADYLRWVSTTDPRPLRWEALRSGSPPAMLFWHRTSPRPLVAERPQGTISPSDPPLTISGMTMVILDTRGRLQEFHAVPPQLDTDATPAPAPRWDALFDAAGLPMAAFRPAVSQWTPRDFADTRAAWEGPLPERPELTIRVEAAAYRGRPVAFLVAGPWTRPTRMQTAPRTASQNALNTIVALVVVGLVLAALLFARHNLRVNRADKRGAFRLAAFMLVGYAVAWIVGAHHVSDVNLEVDHFTRSYAPVLYYTAVLWIIYVALEPYVRRFWPDGILGWARLMSGYVRDPRVGRDVLIGCAFAMAIGVLQAVYYVAPGWIGAPPPIPWMGNNVATLSGLSVLFSEIFDDFASGLITAMFAVLGFVVLRLIFKRTLPTVAAAIVLLALVQAQSVLASGTAVWIGVVFQACVIAIVLWAVAGHGLLVAAVMLAVGNVLDSIPLTAALSHWTAPTSNVALTLVAGLVGFGFYASRAGQPLFGNFELKT